jgi:hypothetical protein
LLNSLRTYETLIKSTLPRSDCPAAPDSPGSQFFAHFRAPHYYHPPPSSLPAILSLIALPLFWLPPATSFSHIIPFYTVPCASLSQPTPLLINVLLSSRIYPLKSRSLSVDIRNKWRDEIWKRDKTTGWVMSPAPLHLVEME